MPVKVAFLLDAAKDGPFLDNRPAQQAEPVVQLSANGRGPDLGLIRGTMPEHGRDERQFNAIVH